jgi:cytochrome c-type biogenesis protein
MVGATPADSPRARRVAFSQALVFVLGFSAVFVGLWASIGLIGYVLGDYRDVLRTIGGAVLIVMGLHVAGLIEISALYREVRVPVRVAGGPGATGPSLSTLAPSYRRSALLGVAFGAGWTPCIGPILGGIIGLASVTDSVGQGTALLIAYAVGLGVPFVLVAIGATEVSRRLGWLRRHHTAVSIVSGALLILTGFLMITNIFGKLSGLAPNFGL